MADADLNALKQWQARFTWKKAKCTFMVVGPNWVVSLDGYYKLMGFQTRTFPLSIYGCIKTVIQKILFTKVWTFNHNPVSVGRWYFEHLYKSKKLPIYMRINKEAEISTLSICTLTCPAYGYANRKWMY